MIGGWHIYLHWPYFRSLDIQLGKFGVLLSLRRLSYRGYVTILWGDKVIRLL